MAETRHGKFTTSEGIHIPYQWAYADSTARIGASGFVTADVGKLCRQLDDNSLWMLTATTPTWMQVNGSGATTLDDLTDVDTSTSAPVIGQALIWNGTNWTPTGPKMYAIATKSVSQTWNSTALQRVGWDSVTVDPESTISGTTTDWIFTAPRTGNYLVTFNLMFLSAWNCESWWYYYVNGVSFWNNAVAGFSTGNWWEVMQSLVVPMSAADTFYIEMKRNTGTASGTTNNSACLIQIVEM